MNTDYHLRAEEFVKNSTKEGLVDWFTNYPLGKLTLARLAEEMFKQDLAKQAQIKPPGLASPAA